MYQLLIWAPDLGDDARGLAPAFDAQDPQSLADPLVDGMRRNLELDGNLFRVEVLIDEQEAVELALGQFCDASGHQVRRTGITCVVRRTRHLVGIVQSYSNPAQHAVYSRAEFTARTLGHASRISQFSTEFTPFSS